MLAFTIVQRAIAGTPLWVWGLLVLLVVLGASQARTRTVHELRLAALPVAMAAYSLFGFTLAGARYLRQSRSFVVPGSWTPLAVILAIFLSRYVVAVSLAMHPDLRQVAAFALGTSLAYGLLGGFFPARAARVWSQRRSH